MIRFWVSEFDVDGIRLDAADVLDFEYMKVLRQVANEVKPDFWLMGEVIHGDYSRWANESTLHSVTNYQLHKALYSGHNDHNYFEIAHTVKHLNGMGSLKLYNFSDNHDVERIYTKLNNKKHFAPVHILVYTLPGVPSVYYGSEFGIEGKKERWSDDSLRPELHLEDFKDALEKNPCTSLIARLGEIRQNEKALSYGDYRELCLTNRQYAFSRNYNGESLIVTVNNDDSDYVMTLPAGNAKEYIGLLSGEKISVSGGNIVVNVRANNGDIWAPYTGQEVKAERVGEEQNTVEEKQVTPAEKDVLEKTERVLAEEVSEITGLASAEEDVVEEVVVDEPAELSQEDAVYKEAFEKGRIAGLQEAILARMERNGYVTDQMRNDVYNQTDIQSLINWVKSF